LFSVLVEPQQGESLSKGFSENENLGKLIE